ncbi:MAG: hypothetical protein NC082_06380 [Clostridiales bacterium]|nr:hypothetical protein [Clostridiales bacterium]
MKKISLIIVAFLSTITLYADSKQDENFDFSHNRFSVSGLLTSSDSYQVEAAYHYMFNRYVGVGGALGYWAVWYENGWASEKDWEIESDDNKPYNVYLRPSLVLKSPAIKIKSTNVGLFAEPGIMLNVPYTRVYIRQYTRWPDYDLKRISTPGGQWLAMDLRLGIYINMGQIGFSAGYMMSDYDVYSNFRHLSYKGNSFSKYYPKKSFMQGAYLTISYYF